MVKLTPIVVHIVTGLVIQYTTSFAAPICQVDEYWQSVLGKCLPCRSICKTLEEKDCRRLCWHYISCKSQQKLSTDASTSGTTTQINTLSNQFASPAKLVIDNSHASTDADPHHEVSPNTDEYLIILGAVSGIVLFSVAMAFLAYCFRHKIRPIARTLCERNKPTVNAEEEQGTREETVALRELQNIHEV